MILRSVYLDTDVARSQNKVAVFSHKSPFFHLKASFTLCDYDCDFSNRN